MAGLVASIDSDATQYVAVTSIQPPRVEIIENLKPMLMVSGIYLSCVSLTTQTLHQKTIPKFQQFHAYIKVGPNVWPERIIVFRDGVSEGELHKVVEHEFAQVKGAHSFRLLHRLDTVYVFQSRDCGGVELSKHAGQATSRDVRRRG